MLYRKSLIVATALGVSATTGIGIAMVTSADDTPKNLPGVVQTETGTTTSQPAKIDSKLIDPTAIPQLPNLNLPKPSASDKVTNKPKPTVEPPYCPQGEWCTGNAKGDDEEFETTTPPPGKTAYATPKPQPTKTTPAKPPVVYEPKKVYRFFLPYTSGSGAEQNAKFCDDKPSGSVRVILGEMYESYQDDNNPANAYNHWAVSNEKSTCP